MKRSICTAIILAALIAISCTQRLPELHEGDIIFHTSLSSQSLAIQLATKSKYSHMGMILFKDGKPFVYEAVGPVKFSQLDSWIKRGKGGQFIIKRLKNSSSILTAKAIESMRSTARSFAGKPYDLVFAWGDDQIYCSELVWKIYDRSIGIQLGELQELKDFDLSHPTVQAKMKERYPKGAPEHEPVISPQRIFEADLHEIVASN